MDLEQFDASQERLGKMNNLEIEDLLRELAGGGSLSQLQHKIVLINAIIAEIEAREAPGGTGKNANRWLRTVAIFVREELKRMAPREKTKINDIEWRNGDGLLLASFNLPVGDKRRLTFELPATAQLKNEDGSIYGTAHVKVRSDGMLTVTAAELELKERLDEIMGLSMIK